MKKSILASVKNEFFDIHSAISGLTDEEILADSDDVFRPHFERLHRMAAMDVDDHVVEEILCDKKIHPVIKHIAHLKRIHGLKMEIETAISIIDGPDSWSLLKRFNFYPNYLELARMEYRGAKLKKGDRVIFIGSGPLPLSLILLCKEYGVEGIGIEQVPKYAELSEKLINILDLTKSIRIVLGNHFSLPMDQKLRFVMVGADAYPKNEIFAHLAKALPSATKVSYRIYEKGLRRLLDEQSVFRLPPEFTEYTRIRPEPPVNNTSVFLLKK